MTEKVQNNSFFSVQLGLADDFKTPNDYNGDERTSRFSIR